MHPRIFSLLLCITRLTDPYQATTPSSLMPCTVERHVIGRNEVIGWFCCNCPLGGPLNLTIDLHCPYCHHKRCDPLRGNDCRVNDGPIERGAAPTTAPRGSLSRSNLEPTARAVDQNGSRPSAWVANSDFEHETIDPSVILKSFPQQSIHRAPHSQEVSALQIIPGLESPQHERRRRTLPINPRQGLRVVKRKRSPDVAEVLSYPTQGNRDLSGTPAASINPDTEQTNERIYACPFLVMNVHRYVHFRNQSCHKPWTLPKLREHIIGRSRPKDSRHGIHTLHECENCFETFSHEQELEEHKGGSLCQKASSYPFPAEGVGSFLSAKISELPKGPKGDRRSEEDVNSWNEWYRVLSDTEPPAQSCSIARCNDPESLKDSEKQLCRTFQRALPKGQKEEALRCYLESKRLEVVTSLGALINQDELKEALMMLEPAASKSDRKQKGRIKPEKSKANLVNELVEEHDPTIIDTTLWKPPDQKDVQNSTNDLVYGSHFTSLSNLWETPTISGHSATRSGTHALSWTADPSHSIATFSPVPPKVSTRCKDTFFSTREDTPDTLHETKPRPMPNEPQAFPAGERSEGYGNWHVEENQEEMKIRTEIQQPHHSHGIFDDLWNPQSTPSFTTNAPLSDGLYPYEGLFEIADMEYPS